MRLRRLAIASLAAAMTVGFNPSASVAVADTISENAFGTYEVHFKNSTSFTIWVAEPCDDNADKCIKVSEFGAKDTARKKPTWSTRAYWTVGSWIAVPVENQQRTCTDGAKFNVTYDYSWDAAKNTGWRSYFYPGACENKESKSLSDKFTLIKIDAPPTVPQP